MARRVGVVDWSSASFWEAGRVGGGHFASTEATGRCGGRDIWTSIRDTPEWQAGWTRGAQKLRCVAGHLGMNRSIAGDAVQAPCDCGARSTSTSRRCAGRPMPSGSSRPSDQEVGPTYSSSMATEEARRSCQISDFLGIVIGMFIASMACLTSMRSTASTRSRSKSNRALFEAPFRSEPAASLPEWASLHKSESLANWNWLVSETAHPSRTVGVNMMSYDVIEARHVGGFVLWLRFRDGTVGEIDLTAELHGPVFKDAHGEVSFKNTFAYDPASHTWAWSWTMWTRVSCEVVWSRQADPALTAQQAVAADERPDVVPIRTRRR